MGLVCLRGELNIVELIMDCRQASIQGYTKKHKGAPSGRRWQRAATFYFRSAALEKFRNGCRHIKQSTNY